VGENYTYCSLILDIFFNTLNSFVNRVKSISIKKIWKLHQDVLQKHFWKEKTFWTDGYLVCLVGETSPKIIRRYIQNQD